MNGNRKQVLIYQVKCWVERTREEAAVVEIIANETVSNPQCIPLDTGTIAELTGIPYGRLCRTLLRLEDKGIVICIAGKKNSNMWELRELRNRYEIKNKE